MLIGIETGRGSQCQNHNVGNITASSSWGGKFWRPPWFDAAEAATDPRLLDLHVKMNRGEAPSKFRAYDSLAEGLSDFARVIVRSFPEVLEQAKERDPEQFRLALAKKYSKDYLTKRAVTDTIAQLQKELGMVDAPVAGIGLLLLAALVFWGLVHKSQERHA